MSAQLQAWRKQCEDLIAKPIEWTDAGQGYLTCPFSHLHTKKTGSRDTVLYIDGGFPHIFCLHARCKNGLREVNYFFRKQLGVPPGPPNPERKQARKMADNLEQMRPMLIEKYRDKARTLTNPPMDPTHFLVRMFGPKDYVWIGQPWMTGKGWERCFRTVEQWIENPPIEQLSFMCANPLTPGCYDRTQENVLNLKYLVLESDTLSMLDSRAMFEAVEALFALQVQTIVFSGGKSLHGWFKHPGLEWFSNNKSMLEALGFDPATMRSAQPVRLGGAMRDNRTKQAVVWVREGGVKA